MADKLLEDSELIVKRFSCDCLFPGHIMDVSVVTGSDFRHCTFEFFLSGTSYFRDRLRRAWDLLRGRETCLMDFYLRLEDVDELVELLERIKRQKEGSSADMVKAALAAARSQRRQNKWSV